MPSADSIWLELDRPENLMAVTSLMWTTEMVDPDRLRAVLRTRLLDPFPVLRRRPQVHDGLLRRGSWIADRDFDLDRHLVIRSMPEPRSRAALQQFIGDQRSAALDPAHPMWRMHVLQGYEGGSAIVTRFHHSIADGIRSTELMLSLLDPVDDALPGPSARVGSSGPVHTGTGTARQVTALLNTVASVIKIGLWTNPRTALEGRPGIGKTAAWTEPVPLDVVKEIAARTGTTVNDVCVALVSGAMARYLGGVDGPHRLVPGDEDVAWMVPVNLEPAGQQPSADLGNHFALVLVALPHGPGSLDDRLAEVHRRMSRIRDSWEPTLTFALARGLAFLPTPVGTALMRALATKAVGVLTNVPGPRNPMSLAGAPVAGVVGWAPTSARQALTVTIFSYAGRITFGFGTDRAVLPDADALVTALGEELADAVATMGVRQ